MSLVALNAVTYMIDLITAWYTDVREDIFNTGTLASSKPTLNDLGMSLAGQSL